MIKKLQKLSLAIATFTLASIATQAQITWDFGTSTALTAYATSGVPAHITADSLRPGNSTGTPFIASTSASSGYTGSSGAGNAGVLAKAGPLDYTVNTATGSAFFEITLTPDPGYYIELSNIAFGSRSTGTGPKHYSIRTDVDGYATEQAGDTISSVTSAWGYRTQFLNITGPSGMPLKLRIYGYDGTGTSTTVNFRIDDLKLTAMAVQAAPSIVTDPQNTTACVGSSAMFYINAIGATSYQWEMYDGTSYTPLMNDTTFSGVDNDSLTIANVNGSDGHMFRCIAMNPVGNDTSLSATLTVLPMVTPGISVSGPTTACTNEPIVGVAVPTHPGSSASYTWFVAGIGPVGSDSVLYIPESTVTAGTYTVTCQLISSEMCASPTTVLSSPIVVTVNAAPALPIISQHVNTLSTTSYPSYQWYFNDTVALGTDSMQVGTQNGNYTVVVTNAAGCSTMSGEYPFTVIGINEYSAGDAVNVFPNPSSTGVFNYTIDNAVKASVIVYDILGHQVVNTEVNKGTHTLDLSGQANGSYFMSIKTDKGAITKKIIVNK